MATQVTLRTLALSLVLVSGAAHAGLFSRKPKPAPPPPPEPAPVVVPVPPPPPPPPIPLEFSGIQTEGPLAALFNRVDSASPEVKAVLQWVSASKDNAGLPFLVVDKANARVYAFTPYAQLEATAPVLLGAGTGDVVLVPNDAPMSAIPPEKRITPAGRYVSKLVTDVHGKTILSIDPANLISLHIVAKGTPAQRRAERLASVTTVDNRVSFGCINVPPEFFTTIVSHDFQSAKGVVYILPEKTTAAQLFGFQPQPAVTAPIAGTALASQTAPVAGTTLVSQIAPVAGSAPLAVSASIAEPAPVDLQAALSGTEASTSAPAPLEAPQAAPTIMDAAAASTAPVAK